jgi:hypothetical protein
MLLRIDGLAKYPAYRHSGASRIMSGTGSGVYNLLKFLDPDLRRDDVKRLFWTFYEFTKLKRIYRLGRDPQKNSPVSSSTTSEAAH